jgi:hypothetical protein
MSNDYAGMRRRFGDDEAGPHRCDLAVTTAQLSRR